MTPAPSYPDKCPVCRQELPERGNRRMPIPHLHGRRRLVHAECAELLEQQTTLDLPSRVTR